MEHHVVAWILFGVLCALVCVLIHGRVTKRAETKHVTTNKRRIQRRPQFRIVGATTPYDSEDEKLEDGTTVFHPQELTGARFK